MDLDRLGVLLADELEDVEREIKAARRAGE